MLAISLNQISCKRRWTTCINLFFFYIPVEECEESSMVFVFIFMLRCTHGLLKYRK